MKISIYLTILLIIILGCIPQKNKTFFSDHWYSCSKNGDYIEMHIKNSQYRFSTDFGSPSDWNEFEIKGDTLIQYDKLFFKDSIVRNKAIFNFRNNNELKLNYLTSDENWTLFRLEGEIENIENKSVLKAETIERSKIRKCVDLRTSEEKKRDSLNTVIDFQF